VTELGLRNLRLQNKYDVRVTEKLTYLSRLLSLVYLATDLTEAILDGRQRYS
jgi:hypothetical protein